MSDDVKMSIDEIVGDAKTEEKPIAIENIFYMQPALSIMQATVLIKYLMKEVSEKIGHEPDQARDKQYI